jgi:hypothetical protein
MSTTTTAITQIAHKVTTGLSSGELFILMFLVLAALFSIYYFFSLRKNTQEKIVKEKQAAAEQPTTRETYTTEKETDKLQESWTKNGEINAEIVNPKRRTIGRYCVKLLDSKDYGRQYLIDGQYLYSLRIGADGILQKMPHSVDMKHPTSELYEAIQTKEDMKEVFGNHDEGGDKLKIGLLVLGGCIALFLMFMAVYKGGK